jgi:adenine deaminase
MNWRVKLINVSLGREKADLVVKNGNLINVFSKRILEKAGVAIKGNRIAAIGNVNYTIGFKTKVIDAKGQYLTPGFIDAHIHIESSMLTLTQFTKAVLPKGTTTVIIDPHEIANVLGLKGIKLMMNEAKYLPLKFFFAIPSCVPAALKLETSGAKLTLKEVKELMKIKNVVALGELMDFSSVLSGRKISFIKAAEWKTIEGHAPGLIGSSLMAYACAGVESNHEASTEDEALQNIEAGLKLEVREGSTARNLSTLIKALLKERVELKRCMLVSDDKSCLDLALNGHINYILKKALEEGVDPITAIQMVTINPAEHFKIDKDVGALAPGRIADLNLIKKLNDPTPSLVIANGTLIAKNGKLINSLKPFKYPSYALYTIHLPKLKIEDFKVKALIKNGKAEVAVIEVLENQLLTKMVTAILPVKNSFVEPDLSIDIVKIAVVERHGKSGCVGLGFVKGFGLKEGALASTIAHDSHNIIVVGVKAEDMLYAVNKIKKINGGLIAVKNNKVLAFLKLNLAGLMATIPFEKVCFKYKEVCSAAKSLGVKLKEPFTQLSFLALPVIPEIKITDKGLINVRKSKVIKPILRIIK